MSWFMLLLNAALQYTVLAKLVTIILNEENKNIAPIFGDVGVCHRVGPSQVPRFNMTVPAEHPRMLDMFDHGDTGVYWHCTPDVNLLVVDFAKLDLDGDGYWTKTESGQLEANYEGQFNRRANVQWL